MKQKLDPKLEIIVDTLKAEFQPKRMFLFGSRANNTHTSNSDFDIVLVVDKTDRTRIENMRQARASIHAAANVSADVFVYDQEEFDTWKEEFSSIPETALNTGKEIDLG